MKLELYLETPPWEWPPDTGKLFLKVLGDAKAKESDRLLAAELAGDSVVINEALTSALLKIVSNAKESEEMRTRAAISLGPVLEMADLSDYDEPDDFDPPPIDEATFKRVKSALREVCQDERNPKNVRRRVLEAAVRAPEAWHSETIKKAYASGDRDWILTAVFAMKYVRGFDKEIMESLASADQEIRCEAIGAAGNWAIAAAWPDVKAVFVSKNPPKLLLLAAIEAVMSISPAGSKFLDELLDSEDEEISEAAEEALAVGAPMSDYDFEDGDEAAKWVN